MLRFRFEGFVQPGSERAGFALTLGLLATAAHGAQLPVPCAASSCRPSATPGFTAAPGGFLTSGQAAIAQKGNTLTISQATNQAILNWSSFNIGAGGRVIFQQPSSTAIALNKIYQQSPSSIFGELTANGQVYLINPNGFVFGEGATVNVAGLLASSLGLYNGDAELTAGILSPSLQTPVAPALASDGRNYVTDASGNPVLGSNGLPEPVQVSVQSGAQINAANGGRVLLAGQSVSNEGSISAPDGQIVLAAGQSVYLAASSDPTLRGLVVEVTGNAAGGTAPVSAASNQAGGVLSAPRGNVSLIGLAVNQDGRISATTAVSANGSVVLQAAGYDPGAPCSHTNVACGNQGGLLTLGADSMIDVLPDTSDTSTAVVAQQQTPSTLRLEGESVSIQGGQISAPGGDLSVVAAANPDLGIQSESNPAAQIRIAPSAEINLAGSTADLPMSANLLTLQLRSNELEDDPLQRNGPLHGQTVIVDVRDGKPAIISEGSWQSALEGIQENILQRTAAGGNASFNAEGDIVVGSGATINVSGGAWNYATGVVQTSELIGANGQSYDISTANPSMSYTGVLNPTYQQTFNNWGVQITAPTPGLGHQESGYTEGFSAGTVTFAAPRMALNGTLTGSAVNGVYQRSGATIPSQSLAAFVANNDGGRGALDNGDFPSGGGIAVATGGTLVIGDASPARNADNLPYFFAPAVQFASSAPGVSVPDGTPLTAQTLYLPVSYLTQGGFAQTQIYSDSTVTVPAGLPLNLGAGGALQVVAPRIEIGSGIQAFGGSIALETALTADFSAGGLPRIGIDIADGVSLNVSGQWTNDSQFLRENATPQPAYQNGGSIDLSLAPQNLSLSSTTSGGELILGNQVSLLANGGAWLQANSAVSGGAGGRITLDAGPYGSAIQVGSGVSLEAFGVQGAAGGQFSLLAPRILVETGGSNWASAQRIDDLNSPGGAFDLSPAVFSQDGFSSVSLTATAPALPSASSSDVLTVAAGTLIDAQTQAWQLDPGFLTRLSGGSVAGFATATTLPVDQQTPYSVSLNVQPDAATVPRTIEIGTLDIQSGAQILESPNAGSSISLTSQGSLLVDGTLRAPGGRINLQITAPDTLDDPGYLPSQRIELGAGAVLDVSGATVLTPTSNTLTLGTVLPGGSVNLIADRGAIVADTGSVIDISGASAVLDEQDISGTGAYHMTDIGSAAGSLVVQSPESISLLGTLAATAGANGSGALQGGSLEVDLNQSLFAVGPNATGSVDTPLPILSPTIELVTNTSNASLSASYGNLAVLGIAQLEQSGIDALKLQSQGLNNGQAVGEIQLLSNAPLTFARGISLDAPTIAVGYGVNAHLSAPSVVVTNSAGSTPSEPMQPVSSPGSLTVDAQQVTLSGNTLLQSMQTASLNASGDLQFEPLGGDELSGSLTMAGNLTMNAARIYPATQTAYAIDTTGNVSIGQTGASPGTPLSAGGSLSIAAANITSTGTLLAPFGQITLDATQSLSLLKGSVTSVSAGGALIPYGQTTLGQSEWIYQAGNSTTAINSIPSRQVALSAPAMTLAAGATVDVSGGGDLSAYEWVPGTGGSIDALGQSAAASAGYYAVLPSLRGQYASYDVQEFTGSNVAAGQSVYLSGMPGLPAGTYPLLPARYALLPGAYLIQLDNGLHSLVPGQIGTTTSGAPVLAGYLTFGDTGLRSAAGYTGFIVYPGSFGQSLAQYATSYASTFFPAAAGASGRTTAVPVPADAGLFTIAVGSSLDALGTVDAAAGTGGAGGTVDLYTIGAADLTVTGTSAPQPGSGVFVDASVLKSWNAGELLLGGVLSSDGGSIDVTANTVTIGSGAQLAAGQVVAVANGAIDVQAGSTVASTSGTTHIAPASLPAANTINLTGSEAGGAALLAVSDSSLPIASRSASAGSGATIDIAAGATLSTRGAVALDAPAGVNVAGTIDASGASWSLASDSIGFVGAGGSSDSLQITSSLLAEMQSAGALRLASPGAITFWTPVSLGVGSGSSSRSALGTLTLSAAAINNESSGASVLEAQTVILEGTGQAPAAPSAGTGTLSVHGNEIDITGGGNLSISGNSQINLQASSVVDAQGTGTLALGGNVTIAAPELTAASGSSTVLSVPSGSLLIAESGNPAAASALSASLGGDLTLSAASIEDNGAIVVPGGRISLQSAGDINLGSGASIDAGGITVGAMGATVGAAGGNVSLDAAGNLTLSPGSSVSVAGAGDSPAGNLALSGQVVTLAGSVSGAAQPGAIGGSLTLDAQQLTGGLPALIPMLSPAGFTNAVNVRVQTGDLDSTAGTTLTANQITLTADNGSIDIAGTLNAPSAGLRGGIGLFAGNSVTLEAGGALLANATGATGRGGEIELSAENGTISLDTGGVVAASGAAQQGTLLLRAPAIVNTGDVAIAPIGATVSDLGQIIIEPVLPAFTTVGDLTANFTPIQTAVTNYLALAGNVIPSRFQSTSGPSVLLEPGIVVESTGDLALSQALDLYAQGLGSPIDLTVRATGSLSIAAPIQDGLTDGLLGSTLSTAPSSTLRFVAGADLTSANPLATVFGSAGNLNLANGAIIQTGTGAIDLVASGNVEFAAGASAYTTGNPGMGAQQTVRLGSGVFGIMNLPTGGGDVSVSAGASVIQDISPIDAPVAASNWQLRTTQSGLGEYGVNLAAFDAQPWTTATFGGGDLRISAGEDVLNVSAASADSLLLLNGVQTHYASGGLAVAAGRNVVSGQFFLADGAGTLTAGQSFSANLARQNSDGTNTPIGSAFYLEDSRISLWAESGITIDGIFNPTALIQPLAPNSTRGFLTYGETAALNAQTSSSDVTLNDNVSSMVDLIGTAADNSQLPGLALYPGTLALRSLGGDLVFGSGDLEATLAPSAVGQLQLFAGRDIQAAGREILMSDASSALVPVAGSAAGGLPGVEDLSGAYGFFGAIHAGDSTPASIVAGRDINNLSVSIPKPTDIEAGRDIVNLLFDGQNLHPSDVTLIYAGRNFTDPPDFGVSGIPELSTAAIQLSGPGHLELLAGSDINLGFSVGVTTVGNQINPNLPTSAGADITMLAGLGRTPDDSGFYSSVIAPSNVYQQQLVAFVESLTGQNDLTVAQADAEFQALPSTQQQQLIDELFFNELNQSGIAANATPNAGYGRGYAAIDALFPGSPSGSASDTGIAYSGDLNLTYSKIYTDAGGAIDLIVPGGAVNVGLAAPPAAAASDAKPPSDLGIVAQGAGNVDIYALGSVNVNSSRVFTLGGGNILIWSQQGSIDAGNGAKSSLSLPPPTYTVDSQGNVQLVFDAAVAGSGIRTIQTSASEPAGNVDLIAPVGTVNAGDAGIGAAGNINIAAVAVTGASNINFGGSASGVPAIVSNVSASLSAASTAAGSVSTSANAALDEESESKTAAAAPLAQAAISWLDVFVTGLGEENCKPDDNECLQRQKR